MEGPLTAMEQPRSRIARYLKEMFPILSAVTFVLSPIIAILTAPSRSLQVMEQRGQRMEQARQRMERARQRMKPVMSGVCPVNSDLEPAPHGMELSRRALSEILPSAGATVWDPIASLTKARSSRSYWWSARFGAKLIFPPQDPGLHAAGRG
jgi:hypothetical protein